MKDIDFAEESDLREVIDQLDSDDLVDEELSLNFLREFKDRINWYAIFKTKYLYYQYDIAMSYEGMDESFIKEEMKTFEQFCKDYNEQFYNEYFKERI